LGGVVATAGSIVVAGWTVGIVIPGTDEICGVVDVVKTLTLGAGLLATGSDIYRAATGQASAISIPFDVIGLAGGSVRSSLERLFGEELLEEEGRSAEGLLVAYGAGAGALGFSSATVLSLECVKGL
jgi:hypothetical protein